MPDLGRKPDPERAGKTLAQSILLPKDWSREKVAKWLKDHDFIASGIDEPGEGAEFWRARQYDPEHFIRFRIMPMQGAPGIRMVIGVVKGQRKDGRLGSARVEFGLQVDATDTQAAWVQREADGGLLLKRVPIFRECVNSYPTSDGGTSREYKSWEAICDAAEYFEDAPVTYLHPRDRMVNAETFRAEGRGHVKGPFEKDEKNRIIWGQVHIADGELAEKILSGETLGISPGFFTEVFDGPGQAPDGSPFDRSQEFITPNHLAFGPTEQWARGGSKMQAALDGNGDIILGAEQASDNHNHNEEAAEVPKKIIVFNEKPYEFTDVNDGFEDALERFKAEQAKLVADAKAERDKALGELAAEQKAHKETQAKLDASESPAERAKWAQARSELMEKAKSVSGNPQFSSDSDELGVMVEALKADGQDLSGIESRGNDFKAGFVTSEFNRLAKERSSEQRDITDAYSPDPKNPPPAINPPPHGGGNGGWQPGPEGLSMLIGPGSVS